MKIAIAGYGIEGKSNYEYWSKDPNNELIIVDENDHPKNDLPDGVATRTGEGVFQTLDDVDLVIRTAGLSPYKIKTDGTIWSSTNEFFAQCPAPIIGVTGTKGKGTVSSMIAAILEADGRKVWLVGNIGIPPLNVLDQIKPTDIVVFELSSYQLWDITRSPHIAVVLLIEPDHLAVHAGMDDYVSAKANILRFQTPADIAIYHPTNERTQEIITENAQGRIAKYNDPLSDGVSIKDGGFYEGDERIADTSILSLPGDHNKENATAAIAAARAAGASFEAVVKGLSNFVGLPHRLELVRELDGVQYYNDSFSSATPATVAAVKAFSKPEIVIIGGIERGGDFTELAEVLKTSSVKHILLIGGIKEALRHTFVEHGVTTPIDVVEATTMKEIVARAHELAEPGDVVILSPGAASFDMFKDFYDRGDQFRAEVQSL